MPRKQSSLLRVKSLKCSFRLKPDQKTFDDFPQESSGEPSLSLIIAIFNRKDELFELLNSLIRQTDHNFEVLVVDDGSKIPLQPTIAQFEKLLNIRYFKKPNSGPGLSRNYGAARARNEWLLFLDSDTQLPPDYIANVKGNLRQIPCDAFGGADRAHRGFNLMQQAISYAMTSFLTTGGIRGKATSVGKFQPRSFNMGIKKSVFKKVGGFAEMRIGEDPDLSLTLWEQGYRTAFFADIAVYHKRRVDFGKFSRQVYQFGVARPILNRRHPRFVKASFAFPSLFLLGFIVGVLEYFLLSHPWILALYGLYSWLIIFDALRSTKNFSVAFLAVIASYIQLFSYGWGFLKSWFLLNVLRQKPEEAFPSHFYRP